MILLLFVAVFTAALLAIGLIGISRRLASIESQLVQAHLQHVTEQRNHAADLERIETAIAALPKPSPPPPTYRATPRYDFESTQVAALDDFKEKA